MVEFYVPSEITVRSGDLLKSSAQTLVNTVNTVGVMGKGIALEFKKRFPEMYEDYVLRCKSGQVRLGQPYLYRQLVGPWILNFPTKEHWRSVANLESIKQGLQLVVDKHQEWGITSIAFPPLGCGLGGLDWEVVGPTIGSYLAKLDIPVELYAPHGTPCGQVSLEFILGINSPAHDPESRAANQVPAGWVAIVEILNRVKQEEYHWPIGRTTFEKISYFATMAGIDTGLDFSQGSFGPHSPLYSSMRAKLIQNGLLAESILGKMHEQRPGMTFSDSLLSAHQLAEWNDTLDRVADLFVRIQTTKQSELAASAHFAAHKLAKDKGRVPDEQEVFEYVKDWKARRRDGPYPDADIAEAIRSLAILGWLDVKGSPELPINC